MQPRSVDPITLRKWNALTWHDPRAVLVGLGIEQAKWQQQGVTVTLDDLRDDRALKRFSEPRQAALFAYLISEAVEKVPIQYAMIEDEDYDCVLRWLATKLRFRSSQRSLP